ncbi:MAG: PAS domain S-box protein, partial [Candidatus Baltobacteraceae bacterium]
MRDALSSAIDEAATEFVYLADMTPPADGGPLIVYMNRAMLDAFGYAEAEVIGRNTAMFWGPQTDKRAIRELRTSVLEHRECGGEYAAYCRDGSIMWARFRGRVLHVEGAPTHWIAIGSDITQSRRQLEQIEELSKFRSDLIAMLAHDFGGPLTAVSGFADLLLELGDDEISNAERAD